MGNIQTKEKPLLDGGGFTPNGIYPTTPNFDRRIARKLILNRRIAPFYKGLAEINDALRDLPTINLSKTLAPNAKLIKYTTKSKLDGYMLNPEDFYRNAIECPICFLYYPKNINYTRCCHQPICTECFLQMKRPNLDSSATCPYCVEPNFAIVYDAPCDVSFYTNGYKPSLVSRDDAKLRNVSIHHDGSEAVTSDDIRPDYIYRSPFNTRKCGIHPRITLNIAHRLFHPCQNIYSTSSDVAPSSYNNDGLVTSEEVIVDGFRENLRLHQHDERSIEVPRRNAGSNPQMPADNSCIEIQRTGSAHSMDSSEEHSDISHQRHKPLVHIEGSTVTAC